MRSRSLSRAVLGSLWLFTIDLQACAVAQSTPPEISDGGDGTLSAGGLTSSVGADPNAGGSGFAAGGESDSTSSAGAAGSMNSAFGGTGGVAGASGGSSFGGTSGGAGGKGAAGAGGAGSSGSAGSGATLCSASIWSAASVYQMGDKASKGGMEYTAAYYTQNQDPTDTNNCCGGGKPWLSAVPCN